MPNPVIGRPIKLTVERVVAMRADYATGATTVRALAMRYQLSSKVAWLTLIGRYWPEAGGPVHRPWVNAGRTAPKKLDAERVVAMREDYATGQFSVLALGARYGVSRTVVWKVVIGLFWKGVGGPIHTPRARAARAA